MRASLVLLLLAVFFAHLLAPAVDAVRRRLRVGVRRRPLPRPAAIVIVYLVLFAAIVPVLLGAVPHVRRSIDATATDAVERLASSRNYLPASPMVRHAFDALVGEVRHAVSDLADASRRAGWLVVVPLFAFVLLNHAPGFRRSALRRLPHGHLQWRADEYLQDVNSALAGYIRAQVVAGALVAVVCAVGFALLGVPNAVSIAAAAGVLELVPVIGPLMVLLVATADAGRTTLAVVLFLGGVRILQDYIVYPRLVRRGMHLPSPVVVVAVWLGAAISGAAGVVLAIPAAGFVSVSARHWREYREIERLVERVERERAVTTINAEPAEPAETNQ